ncbi:uncharacterized protein LOC132728487 [Ruditapes philippinarum]|uniref:uncharacterized protein LOC132728487 n=1 Tax=Ruditapes philippinarum TaxID=129788 RepID=UPI00295B90D3|nr:uncharacterized protein LOC132728487 [Ruditapes philippinarum]
MEWISWIALLQPIIMSLFLVIFRQHWLGQQFANKDSYAVPSADIDEIKDRLKTVEETSLSSKDINGIEESISDLYKSIGMLQDQAGKYSQVNEPCSSCDGHSANIGIAVLALIQLVTVICLAVLWRKMIKVQVPNENIQAPTKTNNNLQTTAK